MHSRLIAGLMAALLMGALSSNLAAHDVPNDVLVHAFLKPEGQRVHLLIRAPLAGMLDVQYPTRGDGLLDLARTDAALRNAATVWLVRRVEIHENGKRLADPQIAAVRVSLPSDKSFASYEEALAHVTGSPLPGDTDLYWNQAMLDVLLEYSAGSDRSQFSIHPGFERLGQRVTTVLRFVAPGGVIRAFEFHSDPGLVTLDPRWHQAALHFVKLGFSHILDGIDHLLFLFALVIPFRRLRTLILLVTSFTVAHSMTLLASAFNLAPDALWFPPLVETLIATSIVYMALENIVAIRPQQRWIITFAFGLVHGFGFSFALREVLQFAGSHLITSLLSFNVGVELGQLAVLTLVVPALSVFYRFGIAERMGTIILSALIAHTGWHWMVDRLGVLSQFPFQWPALDAAFLASAARWLMLLVLAVGVIRLMSLFFKQASGRSATEEATAEK
jgi:hypothetical protein